MGMPEVWTIAATETPDVFASIAITAPEGVGAASRRDSWPARLAVTVPIASIRASTTASGRTGHGVPRVA
jgi:hypothetical protein